MTHAKSYVVVLYDCKEEINKHNNTRQYLTGIIRVIQRKSLKHLDEIERQRDQFLLEEFWVGFMEEAAYGLYLRWIGSQQREF